MMLFQINNDIVIFFKDSKIILDLYKSHKQLAINKKFFKVLLYFSSPKDIEKLNTNEFEDESINLVSVTKEFINKGVLVPVNFAKDDYSIDTFNKSIQYFYWANKEDKDENYQSTYNEFWELNKKRYLQPSIYKNYASSKTINLPFPTEFSSDLLKSITNRQSIRYTLHNNDISLQTLSNLLYYSNGEASYAFDMGMGEAIFKYIPTPGGRASSELYLVNFEVNSIPYGIFHYSVKSNSLELIKKGNFRKIMFNIAGNQEQIKTTSLMLISTSRIDRIAWKYQDAAGYRAIYLEAGALMQNLYLLASALELGIGVIGTFKDKEIDSYLNLDPDKEIVTALYTVGKRKNLTRFDRPTLEEYRKANDQNG